MGGNNLQETSWFASFAPANKPRYAVLAVVSQGGTGSSSAAVAVRGVYEGLAGITGGKVDATKSILVGGHPLSGLPKFRKDGTAVVPSVKSATPSANPSPTSASVPLFGLLVMALWRGSRRWWRT
jgi:penicillin-binding protein 2